MKSLYRHIKHLTFIAGISMGLLFSTGCNSPKSPFVGVKDGRLSGCPDSPNCVSSEAQDDDHRTPPFEFSGDPVAVWPKFVAAVEAMPRTVVISKTDLYLHAEITSRIFSFVDDLELLLQPKAGIVSIRSASRLGKSDFGVNRKRVETLRQTLLDNGTLATKK